jgi:hypothetical protein
MLFLDAEPDFNQQDKAKAGSTVRETLQTTGMPSAWSMGCGKRRRPG